MSAPPLTWLYVPADRPDRVEKALASRAHAVIVDLEDGVAPARKDEARANLAQLPRDPGKPLWVRVNAGSEEDLAATGDRPVIVPKAEGAFPEGRTVIALIETALGVERAFEIAQLPGIAGLGLGEADLGSQTGARDLDWARSRVINAAVAAGLPRPPQSVYPHVRDLDGLAASSARGRALGHLGRTAIHPDQLEVIERAYLPTRAEVDTARATLERLEADGVGTLADGAFVDRAMLGVAQQVLAIADAYGVAE